MVATAKTAELKQVVYASVSMFYEEQQGITQVSQVQCVH